MTTIRTLLPVLLLLAACSTHSAIQSSQKFASLGSFEKAFEVLDDARNEALLGGGSVPVDLETAHGEARLAQLRERARRNIFEEREEQALADLDILRTLAPDYPELDALHDRALYKKAARAAHRGDEFLLRKELEMALLSYIESEKSVPGFKRAAEGSLEVRKALDNLSQRSQEQFLEAVRKLPEFRFIEVRWHASNAVTNDPQREDATALRVRAQKEIAQKAIVRAAECRQKEQFGAALLEYRAAKRLDPSLTSVDVQIVEMEREVKAARLVEQANKDMRTKRFDLAREELSQAFELSVMARGRISELMIDARRLEGEARYQAARDLEVLGQKSEALAAFEELSKDWPEGVSDEKARVDGLRVDVESAKREWADAEAAEAAGDQPKALEHYRNAERFYPGLKDGKARIEKLQAAIGRVPNQGG